jgi:predicted CoA-binding protein
MDKTVAIVGASNRRKKFGNKAVRAFLKAGWTVYPVNPKEDEVEGLHCYKSIKDVPQPIERVSMYVSPAIGKSMLDELCETHHQELWFNPGSADMELINLSKKLGLNPVQDCSIVAIGFSPGMFPDS